MKQNKFRVGNWIDLSSLSTTWKTTRQNNFMFWSMLVFDAFFLAVLFAMNKLFMLLFPNPTQTMINAGTTVLVIPVIIIGYLLTVLLLYSFLKFFVMRNIVSMFDKKELSWVLFWKWVLANAAMQSIFLVLAVFFSAIFIMTVRVELLEIIRNVFLALIGFFYYLSNNTLHSLFSSGTSGVRTVLRKTFGIVFNRLREYFMLIGFTIIAFFVLVLGYYAFDWLIVYLLGSALGNSGVMLGYKAVNSVIVFMLFFGLLAFNRVQFYVLLRKLKH